MSNMLNQTTGQMRLTKIKFLSILAVTAIVLTATFLHADSGENRPDHNQLAGTWISAPQPGDLSALVSYMSDGRVIFSRAITVTSPAGVELVGTGHGEWIRTGRNEFAVTAFFIRSGPSVVFTGFVKIAYTVKLDSVSDQLTNTGTTSIFGADGSLLVSFQDDPAVFKRIVAGQ